MSHACEVTQYGSVTSTGTAQHVAIGVCGACMHAMMAVQYHTVSHNSHHVVEAGRRQLRLVHFCVSAVVLIRIRCKVCVQSATYCKVRHTVLRQPASVHPCRGYSCGRMFRDAEGSASRSELGTGSHSCLPARACTANSGFLL